MGKIILGIVAICFSLNAVAATETSPVTAVLEIQTYPDYGGGDVVFKTVDRGEVCIGYWLSPSSQGFSSNLSVLLSAFHSGAKFRVWGHVEDEYRWGGTQANRFCKVYSIELTK